MIAEFGLFALILALFVAAVQATVPLVGATRGDAVLMNVDRPAAFAQFLLVGLSFGALMWLHVTSDFSVLNVVANSHTDKPLLYKITGVWGNHEGSMMLWTFVLVLYGMAVSVFGRNLPPGLRSRALAVQGMIGFGFILFILLTSNPFVRVDPAPLNGNGLNPLLQDPGLAFHPPFLYLGYVGFSMAFSFAIAALIEGRVDAAWARWVRPWTLVAWCALTLGVAMGSWWSYYTLGWGGYWAWDPVENASLMPWLAGTALLHCCIVVEKRDTMKSWTIFLAIITFSLSLLGTFLVRSGVLTSVHGFATDPARGTFILLLLGGVTGLSLILYAFRAPALKAGGVFAPISREGGLLFNNIVLSVAAGEVLVGTLYPLFVDALGLGKISVGPAYFNIVIVPLAIPLIVLMGVGPLLSWKRGDIKGALSRLKFAGVAALVAVVATVIIAGAAPKSLWAALGLGLAAWLLFGSLTELAGRVRLFQAPFAETLRRAANLPRSAYGQTISHAGLALLLVGVTGSLAWQAEKLQTMRPGDIASVSGYQLQFVGAEPNIAGPNYTLTRGDFVVTRNGRFVAEMQPERRMYNNPPQPLSKVAIHVTPLRDIYVVLGTPDNSGGYAVHILLNPMIPCLFLGAIMMVLGGVVSLTDRHHRIGAPLRRIVSKIATPPAAGQPAAGSAAAAGSAPRKASRSWLYLAPFLVFAILGAFFIHRLQLAARGDTPNLIPSVMIDKPAPPFDLPPLMEGGQGFKRADLQGQVTLVSFFASWCAPCRIEHPLVQELAQTPGLAVVGVNYKDKPEDAKAWLAQLGDPYKTVAVDAHGRAGIDFGLYGVPEAYLIDKQGVIRFKQIGPLSQDVIDKQLVPMVEKLNK
jgi:cytochrome c-type biogenesis protein CcmF